MFAHGCRQGVATCLRMRVGRVEHDNSGFGGDWYLDRVEIDCPSLGRKWYFPAGRWLATGKEDGKLEVELMPLDMATEIYDKCKPFIQRCLLHAGDVKITFFVAMGRVCFLVALCAKFT